MTWTEDFKIVCARIDEIHARTTRLNASARKRAEAKLLELEPTLPGDMVFHCAHNWLVCGKDRNKARKASYIIKQYHDYQHRLCELTDALWHRWHQQVHDKHVNDPR